MPSVNAGVAVCGSCVALGVVVRGGSGGDAAL
jgi:hypothetical protein